MKHISIITSLVDGSIVVESYPELNSVDFYLWGHMKILVYQQKVVTRDALLRCILDAATHVKCNPNKVM
jgi:hypothetical protein